MVHKMKISINMNILLFIFFRYIENSGDILTKILVGENCAKVMIILEILKKI